jgi:hypothetical protein
MTAKKSKNSFPSGLKFIVFINSFAFILTALFWLLVWQKLSSPSPVQLFFDKGSRASMYGFMLADVIWALPLLLLSVIGLRRKKLWGWTAAQMVNILWLYSITAVWVRDINLLARLAPGSIIFFPFALLSFWQCWYLWRKKNLFH